ncbi:MAG: HK97 gp10 family phage protein [Candidatus Pacearchaeota archaeon]|nr:HK97 gp10 family phage protein [Candidatus Pacearchaeota archaeon]
MIKIKVTGLNKLNKFLKDKQQNINQNIKQSLQESGEMLKEEIQASARGERAECKSYVAGKFHDSIKSVVEGNSVNVTSNVDYAGVLEFGSITQNKPEKRHFRNSADRIKNKIVDKFKEAVQ